MRLQAVDLVLDSIEPGASSGSYDKKHIEGILSKVAINNPDAYDKISSMLANYGREHVWTSGTTVTLDDFEGIVDKQPLLDQMHHDIDMATRGLPRDKQQKVKEKIWSQYLDVLSAKTSEALKNNPNGLGAAVLSGARGNPSQLRALLTTPGLYADYKGRVIPSFTEESFAEGTRPSTLLSNFFGARAAVVSTKTATAQAGDLGKLFFQTANDLIVTEDDCGTSNGILLDTETESPRGSILLQNIGDYKAGTMVDSKVEKAIRHHKGKVKVRSPITCTAEHGLCSKCLGRVPTKSGLAPIGYSAGTTAANATAEPIAQLSLNAKHQSGLYKGEAKEYSGMSYLQQFVQSPESFEDRQILAEETGTVEAIEEAPQGGWHINYLPEGSDKPLRVYVSSELKPTVAAGDKVERGKPLTSGLGDVEDVLRLRGVGEGRKYYARRLGQILSESGIPASRNNLEVLARAAVNHVRISSDDDVAGYLPEEVVGYNDILRKLRPPADSKPLPVEAAIGKTLYSPTLHYTPGTKLLPSMVEEIKSSGISQVFAGDSDIGIEPAMVGLRRSNKRMKDWIARQSTSYLKGNYEEDAAAGRDTDLVNSTSYAPALAYGKEFGKNMHTTGKF